VDIDRRYHIIDTMFLFLNQSDPAVLVILRRNVMMDSDIWTNITSFVKEATLECIGLIGNRLPGFYMVTSPQSHLTLGTSLSLMDKVISVYKDATEPRSLICLNTIAMVLNVA
jgi:hypothetical protein